ncbi:CD48 antigen isoform X2 [Nycticebus coucang]|uniref:CD48 antigen isoform X2 n=1 Tax=Nycticebus coucang TaxID=9470 RepID=UPI00234E30CC|nr:CD48 antigen isoform X2 [Nycticebus coucang]
MRSRGWKWCVPRELLLLSLLLQAANTQGTFHQVSSDHVASVVNAVSGSNVILQIPERLPDNYKQLSWWYTTEQKIVEWRPNDTKYFDSTFKGRVVLDRQSCALNISNIQKDDNSTYLIKVLNATESLEKTWMILLQVFDPVRKPVIKIETIRQENSSCYMKLSCAIPDQSPAQCVNCTCTWHEDSGPLPNECLSTLELKVPVPQNYSKFYTCRVSNPVSSENDTVYFTPPCALFRSSGVNWIASWLIVMVPTILGLLLIRDELF